MQSNSNEVTKKLKLTNETEVVMMIFQAINTLDSFFVSQKLKGELNAIYRSKENAIDFDAETYVDLCIDAINILTYAEYELFTKEKHAAALTNLVRSYKDARDSVISNAEKPKLP